MKPRTTLVALAVLVVMALIARPVIRGGIRTPIARVISSGKPKIERRSPMDLNARLEKLVEGVTEEEKKVAYDAVDRLINAMEAQKALGELNPKPSKKRKY